MRHYDALLVEAEKVGWPVNFKTDLTNHDHAFCVKTPEGSPFVWVLRDSGTHIISTSPADAYRWTNRGYFIPKYIEEAFGAGSLYYVWDGTTLRKLSGADEAADFLRQEFMTNGGKP